MREVVVFLPLQVVCTKLVGRSSSREMIAFKAWHVPTSNCGDVLGTRERFIGSLHASHHSWRARLPTIHTTRQRPTLLTQGVENCLSLRASTDSPLRQGLTRFDRQP